MEIVKGKYRMNMNIWFFNEQGVGFRDFYEIEGGNC
jgi:hypothetical protein